MSASIVVFPILLLIICLCLVIPVVMGIYVYRDAAGRGMNAALWTLVCLLAPGFIGLIIYLIVRSEHNDLRCSACSRPVKASFAVCPYCGASLKEHCPNCGFAIQPEWVNCPDCGEVIPMELRSDSGTEKKKDKGLKGLLLAVIIIPLTLCVLMFLAMCGLTAVRSYGSSSTIFSSSLEDFSLPASVADYYSSWVNECDAAGPGVYMLRSEAGSEYSDEVYSAFLVYCNNGMEVVDVNFDTGGWFTKSTATFLCEDASYDKPARFAFYEYTSNEPCEVKVMLNGKKTEVEITEIDYDMFVGLSSYCLIEYSDELPCVTVYVSENAADIYAVSCTFHNNDGTSDEEYAQRADEKPACGEQFEFAAQTNELSHATVTAYNADGTAVAQLALPDIYDCCSWSVIIECDTNGDYSISYAAD